MELSKQDFPLVRVSVAGGLCPEWKPTEVRNFSADNLPEIVLFMPHLLGSLNFWRNSFLFIHHESK